MKTAEVERLNEGNHLMLNHLTLCSGVACRGGAWGVEHPDDPEEEPFPSIFDTDILKGLEARTHARRISFAQCMMGGGVESRAHIVGEDAHHQDG